MKICPILSDVGNQSWVYCNRGILVKTIKHNLTENDVDWLNDGTQVKCASWCDETDCCLSL